MHKETSAGSRLSYLYPSPDRESRDTFCCVQTLQKIIFIPSLQQ